MDLQRIVIGIDFSPAAAAMAHRVARDFAPDAQLRLVHALDLPGPPHFLRAVLPTREDVAQTARLGAEKRMVELVTALEPADVLGIVRCGHAGDVVTAYAHEIGADVLAIGEHGHRRAWPGLSGTTVERILHVADVPVLLVRGSPQGPPTAVLAPVDASAANDDVLGWARLMRRRFGAAITAFYAVSPWLCGRMRNVSGTAREREFEAEITGQGREWLEQRLGETGLAACGAEGVVAIGDPRYEIAAVAERMEADLVIMGSPGAGAVGRAMMGSVASAMLGTLTCPVLVQPAAAAD